MLNQALIDSLENLSYQAQNNSFLQGVLERFMDGVLLVSPQGECIHANDSARQVCQQLAGERLFPTSLPKEIGHICQTAIERHETALNKTVILESEISCEPSTVYRVRVRTLSLNPLEKPCILVMLENKNQSTQGSAIAEIQKYGLTAREAEVWRLRRAKYSYQEIAEQLFVTKNTVKKHLRNIYAKQEMALNWEVS